MPSPDYSSVQDIIMPKMFSDDNCVSEVMSRENKVRGFVGPSFQT